MTDDVIDPTHYNRLDPQPWDVIAAWNLPFDLGCAVKYIARAGRKAGASEIEDLEKAAAFLRHRIAWLKRCET